MISATDRSEEKKFEALFNSITPGNVYFVTGKNGSGKSRFFAYAKGDKTTAAGRTADSGAITFSFWNDVR